MAVKEIPPIMRVQEVYEHFRLGKWKVWKLINKRQIKAYKPGKFWLVETKSLLEYMDSFSNKGRINE